MKLKNLLIHVCFLMLFSEIAFANEDLWNALKEENKVILMRHMPVDAGNSLKRDPTCQNERNLSSEGKLKSRNLADKFKEYAILIDKVYSSPFCRTKDTARLVFGKTETIDILTLQNVMTEEEANKNTDELIKMISNYQGKRTLVLVTHRPNIEAISFESMPLGAFLVIKPLGNNEFEELGIIKQEIVTK